MDTSAPIPQRLPAYPLRRPHSDDQRFTVKLVYDISDVLVAHGYPPIATGNDLLRWQNALFTIIYHPSHYYSGKYYSGKQNNENQETA